jgi:hypothetical protein
MKLSNLLLFLFIFSITLSVFNAWFISPIITAGDSWYYFYSMFDNHYVQPFAWYTYSISNGLGGQGFAFVTTFTLMAVILEIAKILNFSWEIISRFTLYIPFIIISLTSSIFLVKKLFPKNPLWFTAPIIFTFNTYILMVVGGGQLPTALSYAIIPFSLFLFIKLLEVDTGIKNKYTSLIISSALVFSLQCILDLRIAFVTAVLIGIYLLVLLIIKELKIKNLLFLFLTFVLIALINAYWIIPIFLLGINPIEQLGIAYSSSEMLKFLSFAKLENSIGLFHPYWPENIFGKVGFMKPEFLILPLLAFSSLIFIGKDKKETKYIVFFILTALVGVFLGKGASEPFGDFYIWLFEYIPGFQLFRDSFKWYSLIAVSYSMLIPFTVWKIYEFLKSLQKFKIYDLRFMNKNTYINIQNLFIFLLILYFLFLIRPAIFNQLGGTFQTRELPESYSQLNDYLSKERDFYRTLWVPNTMLFGYYSNIHPQISARDFFQIYDYEDLIEKISSPVSRKTLENASVKYVIVPEDTEEEIYLTERRYDEEKYQSLVTGLDRIPWLIREKEFGKVIVFRTELFNDHFWCDCDASINYEFINPTKYLVNIQNAKKGDVLIFSEAYDSYWIAKSNNFSINSQKFNERFNSFILPEGSYQLTVYYTLQRYLDFGVIISITTLLIALSLLIVSLVKKGRK